MRHRKLRYEPLECRLALAVVGLDSTFGLGGQVKNGFVENSSGGNTVRGAVVQPDGKIVGAGDRALVRLLSDGELDPSFGPDGLVGLTFHASAVALQSDGKLVVAGNLNGTFMIARFQSDGQLDNTFGQAGLVSLDLGDRSEAAYAVEVDWLGRIVVTGEVNGPLVVVRLTSNGALDQSFADGGILMHDIGSWSVAEDMAFQTNGSLIVVGTDRNTQDVFVVRVNPNGTVDAAFGNQGVTNIDFGPDAFFQEYGTAVAIQADGRIVASCSFDLFWLNLFRLNTDGSLDTSFSGDGKLSIETGVSLESDLQLLPDGRILAMSAHHTYRILPDGQLDTTFTRLTSIFPHFSHALALAPDGTFIVTGSDGTRLALQRGLANGLDDLSFGQDGVVRVATGPSSDTSSSSAVQADGKLILAGMTQSNVGLIRYSTSGMVDSGFGQNGRASLPAPDGYLLESVADVAVTASGQIIIAGTFRKRDTVDYDVFLVRMNSDGNVDTGFGQQGFLVTDLGANEYAADMLLQNDGKILLAANKNSSLWRANLIRYNANGTLDLSFSQDGIAEMATNGSYLNKILLQPDNRILAGGFLNQGSGISRSLLTRFMSNGALDGTFGDNAKVVERGGPIDAVTDIALATDGSIYATGGSLMLRKYSSTGVLDTSFRWAPFQLQVPFDFRTESRLGTNPQLIVRPDGFIMSGNFGDRSLVVAFRADGTLDERFSGDGQWIATTATQGDVNLNRLLLQADGRVLATGSIAATETNAINTDFVAYRFSQANPPAITTTVAINATGQIEIADRWSHDDRWRFGRTDTSLIVTDLSTDRRVKFTVIGLPEIAGNDTKQITIPLSLLENNRQPLIVSGQSGDDQFTFSNQFNAPTFGMSFRGGAGSDTLDLSNQTVPISWVLSAATSGSARPLARTPMTFTGMDRLIGGTNTDTFRLTYQGSSDRLVIDGGGGNRDSLQLTADQDMSVAHLRWPNDSLHLTVGRDEPQLYAMQNIEAATIVAGASNNWLDFSAFPGELNLRAGAGNDTILSSLSKSLINGQAGDDTIFGSGSDDRMFGGDGNDVLIGLAGNDQLFGDAGADILVGSAGADRLYGGAGQDLLIGGFCETIEALPTSRIRALVVETWTTAPTFALAYHRLAVIGVGRDRVKLTVGTTVLSDSDIDTYFGQADLDWYLLDASRELDASPLGLRDQQPGERISQ